MNSSRNTQRWVAPPQNQDKAETSSFDPAFRVVEPPLEHRGAVYSVDFSPDSRRIVTASLDGTARVWETATGQPVGKPLYHGNWVYSADFSPDGRWIVTASEDGTAQLWESATGKRAGEPLLHSVAVRHAAFSPHGRRIITLTEETAQVWDAATGEKIGEAIKHGSTLQCAVPSWNGRRIVTAARDDTVRLWDADIGTPIGHPMKHSRALRSAMFSPDGQLILTCSDDIARVWNAETSEPVGQPFGHKNSVFSAIFSPDGQWIATASQDTTARVWRVPASLVPAELPKHVETTTVDIQVPPTKAFEAVGQALQHHHRVNTSVFSPDGRLILTASHDNTACLWDASSGTEVGQSLQHNDNVNSAAFSPDGRWIITACQDGDALIWDAATRKPIGKPFRHPSGVKSATFSPDGLRIATGSWDDTARIWDVSSGQPIGQTMKHQWSVNSVSFSPDGRWLATADNRFACVWEASSGSQVVALRHPYAVYSAVFSPDGSRLLTASNDRTAKLWATGTWTQIGNPLQHSSDVFSASFSSDGRWIVTSSLNVVQVWEAATGESVGDPIHHGGEVRSAAFSPDGRRIVTASTDNTARVWDVPEVILSRSGPSPAALPKTRPAGESDAPNPASKSPAAEGKMEIWTDAQGRTLQATLIRITDTLVILKDAYGKEHGVSLAALSPESRKRAMEANPTVVTLKTDAESEIFEIYAELYGRIIRNPDLTDAATAKLLASANAPNHEAEALVGERYYDGIGTFPVNRVEALKWFVRSAKGNNALGRLWIAVMAQNGEIASSDPPQVLFKKALPDLIEIVVHKNSSAPYWRAAAECYAGAEGLPMSARQPRELLEKAIEREDARARLLRGNMLLEKHGSVGASYLRNASDASCATASTSLAKYYLGRSEETLEAPALLRTAAFKNDMEAQILLGSCLAAGNGTDADPAEAAFWLETGLMHSIRLADKRVEALARDSIRSLRSGIGEDHFRRAVDFLEAVALTDPAVGAKQ